MVVHTHNYIWQLDGGHNHNHYKKKFQTFQLSTEKLTKVKLVVVLCCMLAAQNC